jgi:hypothetical protein
VEGGAAVSNAERGLRSEAELAEYGRLAEETDARMRKRDIGAARPFAFFTSVFRTMVPRGQALFLLARSGSAPLAGALFLLSRDRMICYHSASTRDRALTGKQGPSALVWQALRHAGTLGIPTVELGAVTATDEPTHPHYPIYQFVRRFGGRLERRETAEIICSPVRYAFQQRWMMPAWRRLHRTYMVLAGAPAARPAAEKTSSLPARRTGARPAHDTRVYDTDALVVEITALEPASAAHSLPISDLAGTARVASCARWLTPRVWSPSRRSRRRATAACRCAGRWRGRARTSTSSSSSSRA